MYLLKSFLIVLSFSIFQPSTQAIGAEKGRVNPIEAGDVKWQRDLDAALVSAKNSGKPVFVLFQEIPGCLGCQTFGSEVLTHPLLVEAIESEFLPVLVYNNRPGSADDKWLRQYKEPSWNYQVIRFLDHTGKDIIPRKDKVWTIDGVASRMIAALQEAGRKVPLYLRAVHLENEKVKQKKTALAMACFWTGEYKLGKLPGVITTEAGWYDNREITLVTYHTDLLTLNDIVSYAAKERCAQRVYLMPGDKIDRNKFTAKPFVKGKYKKAKSSDQKKQLSQWPEILALNTITPMQLTKINAFGPDNQEKAFAWLSPKQQKLLIAH